MPFFARTIYGPDPSFTPLFRLLDDFDSYSREVQGNQQGCRQRRHHARTFNAKFDVRETETAYELHGELPGIDRENIQIEFTEPQTVVVRGRIEREYTSGTSPAGAVEASPDEATITEAEEPEYMNVSHQATVEDEEVEEAKEKQGTEVVAEEQPKEQPEEQKPKSPAEKFWVSERSIGEFHRTFNFPSRIDQDAVNATLNNGVLTVVVPKAKKHESRRVAIN